MSTDAAEEASLADGSASCVRGTASNAGGRNGFRRAEVGEPSRLPVGLSGNASHSAFGADLGARAAETVAGL
jgi:hypothetical protein